MTILCPACGSKGPPTDRLIAQEMMIGLPERHEVAECGACGSWILIRPPQNLSRYYDDQSYYSFNVGVTDQLSSKKAGMAVRLLWHLTRIGDLHSSTPIIDSYPDRRLQTAFRMLYAIRRSGIDPATSRILDVGCGAGSLVTMLGHLGGNVCGIDPYGSDRGSGRVRCRRIGIEQVQGRWNLVMFHHSLEHVVNPQLALAAACDLVAPTGRILVRIPTVSSYAFSKYRHRWPQLDVPRHYFVPSERGLERLFAASGLVVVEAYRDATDFQFWGSEQSRLGIPLLSPESIYNSSGGRGVFSRRKLWRWRATTWRLNRSAAGDQVCVILQPG